MKNLSSILTPFPDKFGVPRQSLLIEEAWGQMKFPKDDFYSEAFRGIENFTHLWLVFEFHKSGPDVNALVRPPRFLGKEKWGVFSTRSPHRPNSIGLSVVKFDRLEEKGNEIHLWVKGVDLVSGTPILDLKPYIPYTDSIPDAKAGVFGEAPTFNKVIWQCEAPPEKILIEKVIALDPRPGHQKDDDSSYGVSIAGHNIQFRMQDGVFVILEIA